MDKERYYQISDAYQKAILFAAEKHYAQKIPGTELPYILHLSNVAMEILVAGQHTEKFDIAKASTVALLHDVLEDTITTFEELKATFGGDIAAGVAALTKNSTFSKEEKMIQSINCIRKMSKEIWMVKLADRITNLQKPPNHWDSHKIYNYWLEAQYIYDQLKDANGYLADRLLQKIADYKVYLTTTEHTSQ